MPRVFVVMMVMMRLKRVLAVYRVRLGRGLRRAATQQKSHTEIESGDLLTQLQTSVRLDSVEGTEIPAVAREALDDLETRRNRTHLGMSVLRHRRRIGEPSVSIGKHRESLGTDGLRVSFAVIFCRRHAKRPTFVQGEDEAKI